MRWVFLFLAAPAFAGSLHFDKLGIYCDDLSFGQGQCIHALVKENEELRQEIEKLKSEIEDLRSYAYATQDQLNFLTKKGAPGASRTRNSSGP